MLDPNVAAANIRTDLCGLSDPAKADGASRSTMSTDKIDVRSMANSAVVVTLKTLFEFSSAQLPN
jgi:hypothetical protein